MKNNYQRYIPAIVFSIFGLAMPISISAQSNVVLDQNNVSTPLSDNGTFFTTPASASAGYEVPKGGGVSGIFKMGFWYGGHDVNGQLKTVISTSQGDLFPGPSTLNTAIGATPAQWTNSFAVVTRIEILNHIQNYNQAGYVIPQSLLNWPAHGDVSQGFAYYLAPFVDINQDGNYSPMDGDYPCIKGDKAVYMIMNDKTNPLASQSEPIGIEMHYMFYQYEGMGDLDNTTFVEAKMINRGTQTLFDFKASAYLDFDLGNPFDDYIGTDSTRNLVYVYNADPIDEANIGSSGYGTPVPAIGIVTLDRPMESGGRLDGMPSTPAEYYNLMQGITVAGVSWPSNFLFNGNPYLSTGITELGSLNPPGDRRAISSVDFNVLTPASEHLTTYAIIFAEGADHLESVNQLYSVADNIQNYFDTAANTCSGGGIAGLNIPNKLQAMVYPNPSNGDFSVKFDHVVSNGKLSLYDISGRMIYNQKVNGVDAHISITEPAGVYFLNFEENGQKSNLKIILE